MAGIAQTLPVPPLVNEMTMLNAIRIAAGTGGGGGSGTVTSVSVTTQNGVSATVTNPTTTPALAFTLGAITPTTVQLSGSVSGTTLLQSPAVAGSSVITFPSVTGTLAIVGNTVSQFAAGGTLSSLTGFSLRDTGAAFDLSIVATGTGMSAARTLTLNCGNVAHTLALGTTANTITFPNAAALTVAGLETAQTFTARQTISVNGDTSAPAFSLTGAIMTGGTGTTNFPHLFIQPAGATASTSWSTSGTAIGVNLNIDAGDFVNFAADGTSKFRVANNGAISCAGLVAAGNVQVDTQIWLNSDTLPIFIGTAFDLQLRRAGAGWLKLGTDAAGVTNQKITGCDRITSDGVGASLTLAGGNGRGGAGGSLILSTYDTAGAGVAGTLRSRMTFDTAGAVAFPVVTAVVTETVVSDRTWAVTINGVAYKICLKA